MSDPINIDVPSATDAEAWSKAPTPAPADTHTCPSGPPGLPGSAPTQEADPFGITNAPAPQAQPLAPAMTTESLAAQVGAGTFAPGGGGTSLLDNLNLEGDPTLLKRDVLAKQTVRAKVTGIKPEFLADKNWDNIQISFALESEAKDVDGGVVHPGFAFSQFLKLARNPTEEKHVTMTRISRENLLRLKLAALGLKATPANREQTKAVPWSAIIGKSVLVSVEVRDYQGSPQQEIKGFAPVV